jgi:hypothetical protein
MQDSHAKTRLGTNDVDPTELGKRMRHKTPITDFPIDTSVDGSVLDLGTKSADA